jgi:NAD(P)-dependent dehydrogenase (short-subunit alcohol dehydrogenase family)
MDTRITLITGANKGIGFATARHLARAGHTVLLGARDPQRGRRAVADLAAEGLAVRFVLLDVTDTASVAAAAGHIDGEHGRLDILVNNAGISRDRPDRPSELPVHRVREVYETNVLGVIAVTNAMVPLLRRSTAGYIGNVSSTLGTAAVLADPDSPLWSFANLLAYNSSKAALNAITLMYAADLQGDGIRVNALSPGYVATDLNHHNGVLSVDEGGAHIARQILDRGPEVTGAFFSENGGNYPW